MPDIVDPFLDFQSMRLQALLSKIQPCDYETLNGSRVHPLRIAGILSTKLSNNSSVLANANISNIKQQSQHEVHTFYKEVQK